MQSLLFGVYAGVYFLGGNPHLSRLFAGPTVPVGNLSSAFRGSSGKPFPEVLPERSALGPIPLEGFEVRVLGNQGNP